MKLRVLWSIVGIELQDMRGVIIGAASMLVVILGYREVQDVIPKVGILFFGDLIYGHFSRFG